MGIAYQQRRAVGYDSLAEAVRTAERTGLNVEVTTLGLANDFVMTGHFAANFIAHFPPEGIGYKLEDQKPPMNAARDLLDRLVSSGIALHDGPYVKLAPAALTCQYLVVAKSN